MRKLAAPLRPQGASVRFSGDERGSDDDDAPPQRHQIATREATVTLPCAIRRSVFLLAGALASACTRAKSDASRASAAVESGASATKERGWKLAGKPFEPAALLATGTEGETSLRVTVSKTPLACSEVQSAYPDHPNGDDTFDIWLAQSVSPDGAPERWTFRNAFAGSRARSLLARGAMLDDVAVSGDAVVIKGLELALQERGTEGRLLQYHGDLQANLCGRVARKEPDRPQPKLELTVAGVALAVHGASVRPEGKRHYLRLTRAPHRCDSAFTEGYDFYLDLAFAGDPPKLELAALQGDVYPESATGSKGRESFQFASDGPLAGRGEVGITVNGTIDAGGYELHVAGELKALRCTPAD